jgi:integrase
VAARRPRPGASGHAAGDDPTRATCADAAAEWLRSHRRGPGAEAVDAARLPVGAQGHLSPALGVQPLESITPEEIDAWRRGLTGLSNRSKNKLLIQLHGIFRRAQMVRGLQANRLARVEKHPMRASGDIQVFSPKEVWALVRAASSEQMRTAVRSQKTRI